MLHGSVNPVEVATRLEGVESGLFTLKGFINGTIGRTSSQLPNCNRTNPTSERIVGRYWKSWNRTSPDPTCPNPDPADQGLTAKSSWAERWWILEYIGYGETHVWMVAKTLPNIIIAPD